MLYKNIGIIDAILKESPASRILAPELELFTPQQILDNFSDPNNLLFRFSKKLVTDTDRAGRSRLFAPYASLRRSLFNSLLMTTKLEIMEAKINLHKNILNELLIREYHTTTASEQLINVKDLSSSQSNSVFLLEFSGQQNIKLILKYCTPFIGPHGNKYGRIENEYFISCYLKMCGIENVIPVSKPEKDMAFMEYIDGFVSNKLFDKNRLFPQYEKYSDSFLIQLAQNAAAFDMVGKGDRTLNLESNQNVFGNYLVNADRLYPMDNDFLFNETWKFLKKDANEAKLEAAYLLTSKNLEKDKQIFMTEYMKTITTIRSCKEEIYSLLRNVYPNDTSRINIFNSYINLADEQLQDWLNYILSEEALRKSLEFINGSSQ